MKKGTYIDWFGEDVPLSRIFDFDEDDHDVRGKHDCGWTTDKAISLQTDILPAFWKIRKAPVQFKMDRFTDLIINNMPPVYHIGHYIQHPKYEIYVCAPNELIFDNKYINLIKFLGCSLWCQMTPFRDSVNRGMSYIRKGDDFVGALMPIDGKNL